MANFALTLYDLLLILEMGDKRDCKLDVMGWILKLEIVFILIFTLFYFARYKFVEIFLIYHV